MLEYNFPDRKTEAEAIKQMSPDQVGKLRDEVKFRMEGLLASCDDYFKNLIESDCHICAKFGYAYFDIPPGWGFLKGGTLLCDDCIKRWTERYGAPDINREGEITYEYERIPEDSTHWRQADFKFV